MNFNKKNVNERLTVIELYAEDKVKTNQCPVQNKDC